MKKTRTTMKKVSFQTTHLMMTSVAFSKTTTEMEPNSKIHHKSSSVTHLGPSNSSKHSNNIREHLLSTLLVEAGPSVWDSWLTRTQVREMMKRRFQIKERDSITHSNNNSSITIGNWWLRRKMKKIWAHLPLLHQMMTRKIMGSRTPQKTGMEATQMELRQVISHS